MSSSTSVGRGPAHGNNENHDGDPTHKTLGEGASQDDPPVGNDVLDSASAQGPAGVPGAPATPDIRPGPPSDGRNVETGRPEPEAATGKRPPPKP